MPPWKPTPGFGPKLKHDRSMPRVGDRNLEGLGRLGRRSRPDRVRPPDPLSSTIGSSASPTSSSSPPRVSHPRLGAGHPPLLRDPDEPAGRCLRLGRRVPAGQRASRPPRDGLRGDGRGGSEAGRGRAWPGYESYSGAGVEIFGDLGGWAPGNEPSRLPEGVGRSLPKGADVILQVHYHPDGKPEVDRTRIGLYLSRGPVRQTLQWKGVMSSRHPARTGRSRHQGQGKLDGPRRRRGPGHRPSHASARPVDEDDGHLPRRPDHRPDRGRRLGPRLARHLLVRAASLAAEGDHRQGRRPLRQLGPRPQPSPATSGS